MKRLVTLFILLPVILFAGTTISSGINTKDTRMLSQPAISANHIAFIYAEDLWIANADGSYPRRLTVDEGIESNPVFSPDGKTIAFSAQYDGNTDVFIIPVEGGVPDRLTWHPGNDLVRGFTPDGANVLLLHNVCLLRCISAILPCTGNRRISGKAENPNAGYSILFT